MTALKTATKPAKNKGFSLIESMIGTLVIAFGFLSYAYLANTSIKSSHDSYFRTQANFYANSLFERMRANLTIAQQDAKGYSTDANYKSNNTDCYNANCSPTIMRDWDIRQWQKDLEENLMDATGEVSFKEDVDGVRKYTIVINYAKRTQLKKTNDVDTGIVIFSSVL